MTGLYPFVLFLHVLFVTLLVGGSVVTDMALSAEKRSPAEGLRTLIEKRLKPLEALSAAAVLLLGIILLMVNPQGMTLLKSGPWAHMKITFGILATVMILVSHTGLGDPGKKWVRPVRGIAQLFMILAIFAIEGLRYM